MAVCKHCGQVILEKILEDDIDWPGTEYQEHDGFKLGDIVGYAPAYQNPAGKIILVGKLRAIRQLDNGKYIYWAGMVGDVICSFSGIRKVGGK